MSSVQKALPNTHSTSSAQASSERNNQAASQGGKSHALQRANTGMSQGDLTAVVANVPAQDAILFGQLLTEKSSSVPASNWPAMLAGKIHQSLDIQAGKQEMAAFSQALQNMTLSQVKHSINATVTLPQLGQIHVNAHGRHISLKAERKEVGERLLGARKDIADALGARSAQPFDIEVLL